MIREVRGSHTRSATCRPLPTPDVTRKRGIPNSEVLNRYSERSALELFRRSAVDSAPPASIDIFAPITYAKSVANGRHVTDCRVRKGLQIIAMGRMPAI